MKVMIIGGDGFCGWPTSLYLSNAGHDVHIVDNLSRRKIDVELGTNSLTPISSLSERVDCWNSLSEKPITYSIFDINNYDRLEHELRVMAPDAIIHFGEQRAAPYSMKSVETRNYTVDNNITGTHNLLSAIIEVNSNIRLIHLGTMGVYGYSSVGLTIPEGYLNVNINVPKVGNIEQEILYPTRPGSIYHLTKSLDQLLFSFYAKNYGVEVTDLHQGIVWGTQTPQTRLDTKLINRFDYDGDYGTVLNRFLMQAAVGYPLTVHGTGGQTRAFININDTVECIRLAVENPKSESGKVTIYNQVTETHRVRDLATLISDRFKSEIQYLENPRKEDAENELLVDSSSFQKLGLQPTVLEDGLIDEVYQITQKYAHHANLKLIPCVSKWST